MARYDDAKDVCGRNEKDLAHLKSSKDQVTSERVLDVPGVEFFYILKNQDWQIYCR